MNSLRKKSAFALVAAVATISFDFSAMAGTSTNNSGTVQQGSNAGVNNPAVTISFSGQTASELLIHRRASPNLLRAQA